MYHFGGFCRQKWGGKYKSSILFLVKNNYLFKKKLKINKHGNGFLRAQSSFTIKYLWHFCPFKEDKKQLRRFNSDSFSLK